MPCLGMSVRVFGEQALGLRDGDQAIIGADERERWLADAEQFLVEQPRDAHHSPRSSMMISESGLPGARPMKSASLRRSSSDTGSGGGDTLFG